MIDRINALRLGGLARWLLGGAATCAVLCASALPAAAATTCAGRYLLQCAEKLAIFNDNITWVHAAVLDVEPFEAQTSLPLGNRALRQFWSFETAAATARAELEYELSSEVIDANFEAVATRATLPSPVVPSTGVIDRRTALKLSTLMLAEQQEILNLEAMDDAMNRATAARYLRGRQDWVAWQEASAAGYAIHLAAAVLRVVNAQRTASAALIKKRLLFGVGSTDLSVAQRHVRQSGFAPVLSSAMARLGLQPALIAQARQGFLSARYGTESFSLTQFFSAPLVYAAERQFASALRHFAARIPAAGRPPS
jgi:hypothetical protein